MGSWYGNNYGAPTRELMISLFALPAWDDNNRMISLETRPLRNEERGGSQDYFTIAGSGLPFS